MGNCIGSPRRAELETAYAQHADLEKAHSAAHQEVERKKSEANALEHENVHLMQRNTTLQQRCEALEAEYQKRLAERDARIKQMGEEHGSQQQTLEAASRERNEAMNTAYKLEKQVAELEVQNSVVNKQLELASTITQDEITKLRADLVRGQQRSITQLLDQINALQEHNHGELAQAKAMALVESAAAKEAKGCLVEFRAAASRQHEEDGLKLAATLSKLSDCEVQFEEMSAKYKAALASLAITETRLSEASKELDVTKAALSSASVNAGFNWNNSDVDWTDRDYHDRPYKFSHRTTRKDFTVSFKWWDASNDYCVDVREWYYHSKNGRMERTTKGVFLPLPTAQELSRILPEVVRQAKVLQVRSPKGSTKG